MQETLGIDMSYGLIGTRLKGIFDPISSRKDCGLVRRHNSLDSIGMHTLWLAIFEKLW